MYDLIIVGGGPAGSAAGRAAGRKGLHTVLFEKERFPRYKACGGALSEQAMSYLDFAIPKNLIERDVYGARVHYRGRVIERQKNYRIAILVSREILDNYLLEKAQETGLEAHTGVKVDDFEEAEDYVSVYADGTTYRGRFLIISEGAHGALKYKIRRVDKKDEYSMCIVAEIPEENKTINQYIINAIDIHCAVAHRGYGWIFPHEGYFSVGIGGIARDLVKPREVMRNFMVSNGFSDQQRLKFHVLPVGGIARKIASNRVLLCGDAAGFVDPFYGEGIAYAIRSGQLAVETIALHMGGSKKNVAKTYNTACKEEFGYNLRNSLWLTKLVHSLPQIFFAVFTNNDEVLDRYLEVPALKSNYKEYMKWFIPRLPKYLLRNNGSMKNHADVFASIDHTRQEKGGYNGS
jgi:geranylgeranyl reductase family protein